MITLNEALALTNTEDKDMCYLRRFGDPRYEVAILTGKEIRDSYDIQAVKVHSITPRFTCGDWAGMEFEVSELGNKKHRRINHQNATINGQYPVNDVANYILWYMKRENKSITNLHLQGLLYFLWVEFFNRTGCALFGENFEAWKFGPVIRSVYDKFCMNGGFPITQIGDFNICKDDQQVIVDILRTYVDVSVAEIVDRLHEYRKPWFTAYDYGRGEGNPIPFEVIINKECKPE